MERIHKKQQNNKCKTSKTDRRKKFNYIKDVLHRGCGNKIYSISGLGNKKPLICDICKERVFHLYGKLIGDKLINTCKHCKNKKCNMCGGEAMLYKVHIDKNITDFWCENCIEEEENICHTKKIK